MWNSQVNFASHQLLLKTLGHYWDLKGIEVNEQ